MHKTTKMLLVPETAYNSLISQQRQMVHPSVVQMANLDEQMQSTLDNPGIPTDVKAAQYNQLSRRYRNMHTHLFQEPPPPPPEPDPASMKADLDHPDPVVDDEKIIKSMPKRDIIKARLLLDHIQKHSDTFKISEKDELLDRQGKPIPGSNITDLVHEMVRNRRDRKLDGVKEFAAALKTTNVPKEALSSVDRLDKFMYKTPTPIASTSIAPDSVRKKKKKGVQVTPKVFSPRKTRKKTAHDIDWE